MPTPFDWHLFHPAIEQWFTTALGEPTEPQHRGWPEIAAGRNTLILAPTGSGKTLAAFLWCLNDLLVESLQSDPETFERNHRGGIHTLYISPLKALNNDIHRNLQEPLKGIRRAARKLGMQPPALRVLVRTGDTPPSVRQSMLRRPPHILITTPESFYLMLTSPRAREMYRTVKYVIVDEIHALSGSKRGVHLALSLERLAHLCRHEFVRIGLSATQRPLERIAAFLGGSVCSRRADEENDIHLQPRAVSVLDCGLRKELDVKVISPVKDFTRLPAGSVWPAVVEQLYRLVQEHRTTLIFVNMRAQAEKLARWINEMHRRRSGREEEIALAHHGSLSKETRLAMEERLKAGDIPALVATASLELGIDIGSIDLVVQIGSPGSVSRALQRVGRAGHLLTATSKGRLLPLFRADISELAVITREMVVGEIEETEIPENCLDVLAQQIVATVGVEDWHVEELYRLIRQAYPYRDLGWKVYLRVLEMLSGRMPGLDLRELRPRLSWDRVNDRLIARRSARLLAIRNGGTIPDRGYYGVYLADSSVKVGEMEEEFVFESRVGDVFFLGSSEWQITSIERDRILVAPAQADRPRAPFWKGDVPYRDYALSLKVGRFRREAQDHLRRGDALDWLLADRLLEEDLAGNLLEYFSRQIEATGELPTDDTVVVEAFRDELGDPRLVIHAGFGGRVNGPWALALRHRMEEITGTEVQTQFDNDGILLRFVDLEREPPLDELFRMSPQEIEERNLRQLDDTALFATRFRYNAARALMLPRSTPGRRMPLWMQRLKAADLLEAVRKQSDFPLVLETYRDCLRDALDLPHLREVIEKITSGEIRTRFVRTDVPSPFSAGLLFRFVGVYMYEDDRARRSQQEAVLSVSREMLKELLGEGELPPLIDSAAASEAERFWGGRSGFRRARNAEELYNLLLEAGDLTTEELRQRCDGDCESYLQELRQAGRILQVVIATPAGTEKRWICTEDAEMYAALFGEDMKSCGIAERSPRRGR